MMSRALFLHLDLFYRHCIVWAFMLAAAWPAFAAPATRPAAAPVAKPNAAPAAKSGLKPAPTPSTGDLRALGEQLQARRREQESERAQQSLVPWSSIARPAELRLAPGRIAVRLAHRMASMRAAWTFEPLDGRHGPDATLRVALPERGEQWISLAPGRWRVSLVAARPNGAHRVRLPAQTVTAERGRAYELVLNGETEQALKELERAMISKEKALKAD